jgi:hypothetical protein
MEDEKVLKATLEKQGVKFTRKRVDMIRKITSIGSKSITVDMAVSKYPITMIIDDHRDSPYPLGEIEPLKGIQDEMNYQTMMIKQLSKHIVNPPIFIDKKAIGSNTEVQKIKAQIAKGDRIVAVENKPSDVAMQNILYQTNPATIPQALVQREQMLAQMMSNISGMGNMPDIDALRDDTDVLGDMQNQETIARAVEPIIPHIKLAKAKAALVEIELWKNYGDVNGEIVVKGEDDTKQVVKYNSVVPEAETMSYENAIAFAKCKPSVTVNLSPKTDKAIKRKELAMVTQTVGGNVPELLVALINESEIPNKRVLIESIMKRNELEPIIQQLQAKIEEDQQIIQELQVGIEDSEAQRRINTKVENAAKKIATQSLGATKDIMGGVQAAQAEINYRTELDAKESRIASLETMMKTILAQVKSNNKKNNQK